MMVMGIEYLFEVSNLFKLLLVGVEMVVVFEEFLVDFIFIVLGGGGGGMLVKLLI